MALPAAYDPYSILAAIPQYNLAQTIGEGLSLGRSIRDQREEGKFRRDMGAVLGGGADPDAPPPVWGMPGHEDAGVSGTGPVPSKLEGLSPPERSAAPSRSEQFRALAARYPDKAPQLEKLAAAEDAKVRQAAYSTDLEDFLADPNPTKLRNLQFRYQDEHGALKDAGAAYSDEQAKRNIGAATSLIGYLDAGMNDRALDLLKDRKKALQNPQGTMFTPEPETSEVTDALIELVESGKPENLKRAQGIAAMVLAGHTGEKAADTYSSLVTARGKAEQQPYDARKAAADARTAEAEAEAAPGYYGGRAANQTAALALKGAQTEKARRHVVATARAQGVSPGKVTVAGVMGPIYAKVAAGGQLSEGEQAAWDAYTHKPRASGGGSRGEKASPARIAASPDGTRLVWDAARKSWVPAR